LIANIILFLRNSRGAQVALLVIVTALIAFTVAKCTGGNKREAAQAEQTSASGQAIANAAQDAVETVSNRSEADLAIDAATAQAKKEIKDAKSPAAVRAAVVKSLCARAEYKLDPACRK
jgi:hypothetical protein